MDHSTESSNHLDVVEQATDESGDAWSEDESSTPVYESRVRRCLSCGEQFESAWSGERICRGCKAKASWRSGWL